MDEGRLANSSCQVVFVIVRVSPVCGIAWLLLQLAQLHIWHCRARPWSSRKAADICPVIIAVFVSG